MPGTETPWKRKHQDGLLMFALVASGTNDSYWIVTDCFSKLRYVYRNSQVCGNCKLVLPLLEVSDPRVLHSPRRIYVLIAYIWLATDTFIVIFWNFLPFRNFGSFTTLGLYASFWDGKGAIKHPKLPEPNSCVVLSTVNLFLFFVAFSGSYL